MELNRNLLNLNNRNFGSIEKFRLVENRLYAEKKRSWNQALIENIFAQEIVQKHLLAGLSSFVHAFYFPVTSLSEILERFSKDDATSNTT
jgi:hypothetical protein